MYCSIMLLFLANYIYLSRNTNIFEHHVDRATAFMKNLLDDPFELIFRTFQTINKSCLVPNYH